MTGADFTWLVAAACFGLYGLVCSLQVGIGLNLLTKRSGPHRLPRPELEIVNVALLLGIIVLATSFTGSLRLIYDAQPAVIIIGAILLLARLYLSLTGVKLPLTKKDEWARRLFLGSSFLVPLALAAAGAYLLTGQSFWSTRLGWVMELCAAAGLVAAGTVMIAHFVEKRLGSLAELAYLIWLLALGSLLPLTVQHTTNYLSKTPIALISGFSFIGLCLVLFTYTFGWRRAWWFPPLLGIASTVLLASANRPFLVAGQQSLASSYAVSHRSLQAVYLVAASLVAAAVTWWAFRRQIETRN